MFRNLGDGRFEELIEEAGPGVAAAHASRGCAFGDFDNDGDVDVLVMNMNEPPSLLRNDVIGRRPLAEGAARRRHVEPQRDRRARDRPLRRPLQAQEVTAQSSFYSANDRRLHFGLGPATAADLTIRWPNGATETFARSRPISSSSFVKAPAFSARRSSNEASGRSTSARACCCALLVSPRAAGGPRSRAAAVHIDDRRGPVEGRISPALYGQFMEFMYEGIKGGLHAELLRNRSFEEAPNVIGLSRRWERYPDDRNDDYGLTFRRDEDVAYPARRERGRDRRRTLAAGASSCRRHRASRRLSGAQSLSGRASSTAAICG